VFIGVFGLFEGVVGCLDRLFVVFFWLFVVWTGGISLYFYHLFFFVFSVDF